MKVNIKLQLFLLFLSIFIPNLFNIRLIGMNITFGRTAIIVISLLCFYRDNRRILFRHKMESISMSVFACWLVYGILLMLLKETVHRAAVKELINIFFGALIIYCIIRLIGDSKEMLDCAVSITEKLIMICIVLGLIEIITGRHLKTSIFCDLNHMNLLTEIYGNMSVHQATGFQYGTNDFSAFLTFFFPVFLLKNKRKVYDDLMIGGIVFICAVNSSTLCILTIILSMGFYLIKEKRIKAIHMVGISISLIIVYAMRIWLKPKCGNTFSLVADLQNHLHNYQMGGGSSYKRIWTYIESIFIGVDTYFMGIGPANFTNYIASGSIGKALLNPHNLWLEIFTEYGALITVFYVTLLFVLFRKAGHIYKRNGVRKALLVQIMLMDYIIVGIVPSTFISYWYQWILVALGISTIKIYEVKKRERYCVLYEKPDRAEPKCDLLYIIFIDIEADSNTGSSVRPLKMLRAFQELGLNIKILSGEKTKRKERRKKIEEIIHWLDINVPQFCYIEPSSGPFYDWKDLYLLKKIHDKGIPIGLFYRDAYWMFPEYGMDGKKLSVQNRIKLFIIKWMQKRELLVFQRTCDHVFFPSDSMAKYFNFSSHSSLPPGCVIRNGTNYENEKFFHREVLTFIFVGGAARNHGTFLTMEAFEKANQNGIIARLIYICPKKQWEAIKSEVYKKEYVHWLSIYHVSGDESLAPLYEKADVALLAAPGTEYRNFSVPVKIYEYISYNKPILVTNCYETEKAVLENQVGWSVPDNALSVCNKVLFLYEHQEEIYEKKSFCKRACINNLWVNRAKEVINVLTHL